MPQNPTNNTIPLRPSGRTDVKVSAIGFGGHHLGDAENEEVAVRLVRDAVEGGISFLRQLLGISPWKIGRLDGQRVKGHPQPSLSHD